MAKKGTSDDEQTEGTRSTTEVEGSRPGGEPSQQGDAGAAEADQAGEGTPDDGVDTEDEVEPAIRTKYRAAKKAGKDLRVKAPARKQKRKKPEKVKQAQSRLIAQEKQRKALEARKAGLPFHEIARLVGYADASGAAKAVKKASDKVIQEPAMDLKRLQIERCNHMLVSIWQKVAAGDERAMGMALSIMDKLDRYEGTEQAQKHIVQHTGAVLVADGDKESFIAAMRHASGIDVNGHNTTARQVPTGQQSPVSGPLAIEGPNYPPGMTPPPMTDSAQPVDSPVDNPVDEVVDAELVEEDRDKIPVDDIPKKTYRFGVDPTVRKGDRDG